jgi:hypothetical protein
MYICIHQDLYLNKQGSYLKEGEGICGAMEMMGDGGNW